MLGGGWGTETCRAVYNEAVVVRKCVICVLIAVVCE